MGKPLDNAAIAALLKPKAKAAPKTSTNNVPPVPPQRGPLRFFDKERICLNSGYYAIDPETNERYYKKTHGKCGTSTHWELDGVPYCTIHILYRMNEELMKHRGIEPTEVRES